MKKVLAQKRVWELTKVIGKDKAVLEKEHAEPKIKRSEN